MANKLTVQHKRSSVAGNKPVAATIAVGELAINFADKTLYTKDAANAIIDIGNSKWTTQTGGVSRADKITIGAAAAPKVAIDIVGSVGQNAQVTTGVMNASLGQVFTALITGATTFSISNGTGIPNSTTVVLRLTNGGTAAITWTGIKWPGGTPPTLTAAGVDIITFFTADAGTTWYGNSFALDGK